MSLALIAEAVPRLREEWNSSTVWGERPGRTGYASIMP
jgi:hypothetical protein